MTDFVKGYSNPPDLGFPLLQSRNNIFIPGNGEVPGLIDGEGCALDKPILSLSNCTDGNFESLNTIEYEISNADTAEYALGCGFFIPNNIKFLIELENNTASGTIEWGAQACASINASNQCCYISESFGFRYDISVSLTAQDVTYYNSCGEETDSNSFSIANLDATGNVTGSFSNADACFSYFTLSLFANTIFGDSLSSGARYFINGEEVFPIPQNDIFGNINHYITKDYPCGNDLPSDFEIKSVSKDTCAFEVVKNIKTHCCDRKEISILEISGFEDFEYDCEDEWDYTATKGSSSINFTGSYKLNFKINFSILNGSYAFPICCGHYNNFVAYGNYDEYGVNDYCRAINAVIGKRLITDISIESNYTRFQEEVNNYRLYHQKSYAGTYSTSQDFCGDNLKFYGVDGFGSINYFFDSSYYREDYDFFTRNWIRSNQSSSNGGDSFNVVSKCEGGNVLTPDGSDVTCDKRCTMCLRNFAWGVGKCINNTYQTGEYEIGYPPALCQFLPSEASGNGFDRNCHSLLIDRRTLYYGGNNPIIYTPANSCIPSIDTYFTGFVGYKITGQIPSCPTIDYYLTKKRQFTTRITNI